ncbi:hypothetical protein Q7W47_11505 [Streptococcus suis]|nr:hypothetical protein [Streptococcus suis]
MFTIQPDQIISQAENALDFTTWTKEEQDMWDKQLDSLEVSYATLMTAREEGREEGLIDSARNFLKSGFPPAVIAENLNLPLERVLQLQSELTANS